MPTHKSKMIGDAAATAARTSLEASQSSAAVNGIIGAESSAAINAANSSATLVAKGEAAALTEYNKFKATELAETNKLIDKAHARNEKIINARREYLKDEATSTKTGRKANRRISNKTLAIA